jgi:hypothetical protein
MAFEKKHHRLLPTKGFINRQLMFFLVSALLIFISLAIGPIGHTYFANLSWIDSFYNASMILIGMGPFNEMKFDSGKLFASFYALFNGVALLSNVAVLFAPIINRLLYKMHI